MLAGFDATMRSVYGAATRARTDAVSGAGFKARIRLVELDPHAVRAQ